MSYNFLLCLYIYFIYMLVVCIAVVYWGGGVMGDLFLRVDYFPCATLN